MAKTTAENLEQAEELNAVYFTIAMIVQAIKRSKANDALRGDRMVTLQKLCAMCNINFDSLIAEFAI